MNEAMQKELADKNLKNFWMTMNERSKRKEEKWKKNLNQDL